MALTKLIENVNNIQQLSDKPNETDGLTSAELKERFDRAGTTIKTYLNEVLTTELDRVLATIPDASKFVTTNDTRLSNSRQCNNSFDNWSTARTNLKVTYGTELPSNADNGAIFFLYS